MVAWCAVRASAGSEFDFALIEVSFELGPFFVGDWPILGFRSFSASICEPLLIVLDDVLLSNDQNLWMSLGVGAWKWAHLPEDDVRVQWF